MKKGIWACALGGMLAVFAGATSASPAAAKSSLNIIQKPIIFDATRERLSLEYLKTRYGIEREKAQIEPRMVVAHWTAIPTLEASFNAMNPVELPGFRTAIGSASALNVSAHYLIDQDGTIYQLLPNTTFARHVIGLNHTAIGIENVGNGTDQPLTEAQLEANINLIRKLGHEFPIEYVIGHHEYTKFVDHPLFMEIDNNYRTEKSDPGDAFMNKLRAGLGELNLKPVPQG
ncbi:peptidoglycan recognition protein family protein [Biformimicrobium ophioploci]|uniref:N-acetylmuramoyl-L-alanine amidase n=1 Tax=Biformimicrobium ophioploci TaxID=3036711 RepID=A0ABQ6M2R0_9GAMM|nr:peptidoglycan recognition family protein [Microbulbifer sp. NKW57]GMG88608.1 peptidoglycan recognition family protein [Microbulbifer sp. NKW57]